MNDAFSDAKESADLGHNECKCAILSTISESSIFNFKINHSISTIHSSMSLFIVWSSLTIGRGGVMSNTDIDNKGNLSHLSSQLDIKEDGRNEQCLCQLWQSG